jgi:uncharacterized damage-inducible protein DinB
VPLSPQEVSKLLTYNRWANARTLEPVSKLTAEEYGRTLGGSFPSVGETLTHIYASEWIWLERWQGRSPRGLPSSRDVQTLEALRKEWQAVEHAQRAFVDAVTEARMEEVVRYVNVKGETWSYPLRDMLVHVVNHSTYHRGQVAAMLRQLGKTPQSTDYLLFLDER